MKEERGRWADNEHLKRVESDRNKERQSEKVYISLCALHVRHPVTLWWKNSMKSVAVQTLLFQLVRCCSLDQKPLRTRGCLSLSQWIYHLQPARLPCSLLPTPCPQFLQFPMATNWTKRDFWVDILLWKISFLLSTASTSVDHCGRCCTFVLSGSLS